MAWSPYKDRVVGFVARHPGCSKYAVARHVTRHRLRDPSRQYYIVNTAIRHGWIVARRAGSRWELYLPGAGPEGAYPSGPVTFDAEGGFRPGGGR